MSTHELRAHSSEWLKETYGLSAGISDLPGELDLNLEARTETARYVLKIMRPDCDIELVRMQISAIGLLRQRDLSRNVPAVMPTLSGSTVASIRIDGSNRVAWLIEWQQGSVMSAFDYLTPAMAASIGHLLARVDRGLENLDHPLLDRSQRWNLCQSGWIGEHLQAIEGNGRREIVRRTLEHFRTELEPRLAALASTPIYNDGNENNLFFTQDDAGAWEATGIIDFGDMIRAPRVCEPAIAMAYAMMGPGDPLARGAALAAGYHQIWPLSDAELALLVPLARLRLVVSVTNSARERLENPDNTYMQVSEAPAWKLLEHLDGIDDALFVREIRRACALADPASVIAPRESVLRRRQHLVPGNQTLFYDEPLRLVRGERHFLYDAEGIEYLDVYNNVPHVGHAHPHVARAVFEQMSRLNTNSRYLQDVHVDFAERMLARLPPSLTRIVFVNSGSEANELAIRLARAATGARDMIVMDHGYHGNTTGAMDISPYKFHHPRGVGFAPDWVHIAPQPDLYRGVFRGNAATSRYVEAVRTIIEGMSAQGRSLAGFISECLPSVGGQIVLPPGYLPSVYALVRAAGGICIADDVQTSHGRLGHWFSGFTQQGVEPDIVVMGKPMGNGFPLAAVAMTSRVADAFATGPEFFSTFGGSSAACAAGAAVLDVLHDEQLQQRAREVGEVMLAGLNELASRHQLIGEVRGFGNFLGIDLVRSREGREAATRAASYVKNELRQRQILLGVEGPENNVLKVRPPMSFDLPAASRLLEELDQVLAIAEASRLRELA
jgi:4-aminobutyrate aminotransferase-like enzyme/Ser/Thr protein kinase RdoA (MazF antagonist)